MNSSSAPTPPKTATALHPQIIILLADNSTSMRDDDKYKQVAEAILDLVMTVQSLNLGSSGSRFILNLCSFGDDVQEMALAAVPNEIDLNRLQFDGEGGGTELHLALKWAVNALDKSLDRCRAIPHYLEEKSPDPLCVAFTDGEFDPGPCRQFIDALHRVPIQNGKVDIIAVGVGVQEKDYPAFKEIASREDYAIQIGSQEIADFLGEVTSTIVGQTTVNELVSKRR